VSTTIPLLYYIVLTKLNLMIISKLGLEQIKKGNVKAFENLFFLYKNKVYNFVYSSTYNKQVSEDITQNVFLTVWKSRESIELDKNFDAFIFKIARNMVFRHTEQKILAYRFSERYLKDNLDVSQSVEENIDLKLLFETLMVYVDKLPEKRREIFLLSKIDGFSIKEIAIKLQCSPKSVENHIYRSILFLKKHLSEQMFLFVILLIYFIK